MATASSSKADAVRNLDNDGRYIVTDNDKQEDGEWRKYMIPCARCNAYGKQDCMKLSMRPQTMRKVPEFGEDSGPKWRPAKICIPCELAFREEEERANRM